MHTRSEHPMLKHCPSIRAQRFSEHCSTDAPNELTNNFLLLKHQSHVSDARRGAER